MKKFTDKLNESVEDKIPTAEDFLQNSLTISHFYDDKTENMVCFSDDVQQAMIEFAKLHVEACKKEIIEKVEINDYDVHGQYSPDVDRDSILNAYPLENIK
jgi:hypothetical protein